MFTLGKETLMKRFRGMAALLGVVAVIGCSDTAPTESGSEVQIDLNMGNGVVASSTGGGHYVFGRTR